ncbi:hypothetical protein [Sphaerisporangium rufum]|nr:hypothetical protein [Sphaerisporangium rufum]
MKTSAKHSTPRRALIRGMAVVAVAAATVAGGTVPAGAAAVPKFKEPAIFGTSFQADPHHDFTRGISSRHDGILRGWVTHYRAGVAEYTPIKWVKDRSGNTEGWFTGPKQGDVMAYASRVSPKLAYYSALACTGSKLTVDRRGLGARRCSAKAATALLKRGHRPGLITVYRGKIVKFQEIYTP